MKIFATHPTASLAHIYELYSKQNEKEGIARKSGRRAPIFTGQTPRYSPYHYQTVLLASRRRRRRRFRHRGKKDTSPQLLVCWEVRLGVSLVLFLPSADHSNVQ